MFRPRNRLPWILGGLFLAGAAILGLDVARRTRAVARELLDPPFYHPRPLAQVEALYSELAQGGTADPGGVWRAEEVQGLQLWTLRRARPAPGLVLLLHGFGDDRWGTAPALRWFPALDAAIFTYRRRDDALRAGGPAPCVSFGAQEHREVVAMVRHLEATGLPRERIVLVGRSLGATVGLLALARLEAEGGPLGGIIWEGPPLGTRDYAERLVRGPRDEWWHDLEAPLVGLLASRRAAALGGYDARETDLLARTSGLRLRTPALCFLAAQDRLSPPAAQRLLVSRFQRIRVVEVPTWHLNCAQVLGAAYDTAIREETEAWLGQTR